MPAFEPRDDLSMMAIVSGLTSGEPSEYLVIMNIALGSLLKYLYTNFSGINFYATLLYLCHFISVTTVLYVFLKREKSLMCFVLYSMFFFLFELLFLMNLHYTSTAFMVGTSGALLFITSLDNPSKDKWGVFALSTILLLLAGLIRWQALLAIIILICPLLMLKFLEQRRRIIPLFLITAPLLFSVLSIWENKMYLDKYGDPLHFDYHYASISITDNPVKVNDASLKEVGWSRNDFELFYNHYWLDNKTYSQEAIIKLSKSVRSYRSFQSAINYLIGVIQREGMNSVNLCFCITLVFLFVDKKHLKYSVISIILLLAIYCGLSMFFRIPHRVYLPLLVFVCTMNFYFVLSSKPLRNIKRLRLSGIVIVSALLLYSASAQAYNMVDLTAQNTSNRVKYSQAIRDLTKLNNKLLIVRKFNECDGVPLFSNTLNSGSFNVLATGWLIYTAGHFETLKRNNIDNLITDLYERDDIYLLGCPKDELKQFILEHYQQEIDFIDCGEDLEILKPIRAIKTTKRGHIDRGFENNQ